MIIYINDYLFYLTMFTKNKITKGLMFRCTKAAKTKQYVQVSS